MFTSFGLIPERRKSNRDLLSALEVATFPTIRTREYVLTLAFDLFVELGDTATASTVAERMNRVARGRPRVVNAVIEAFPESLANLILDDAGISQVELARNWLNAAHDIDGLNPVLVEKATRALNDASRRLES